MASMKRYHTPPSTAEVDISGPVRPFPHMPIRHAHGYFCLVLKRVNKVQHLQSVLPHSVWLHITYTDTSYTDLSCLQSNITHYDIYVLGLLGYHQCCMLHENSADINCNWNNSTVTTEPWILSCPAHSTVPTLQFHYFVIPHGWGKAGNYLPAPQHSGWQLTACVTAP